LLSIPISHTELTIEVLMHSYNIALVLFALLSQIPICICLGNWTWMYGENTVNSNGTYGEKGVPNSSNIPSGRQLATTSYDKRSNTLWLFGGTSSSKKIISKILGNLN
jgi:hypothetical protein